MDRIKAALISSIRDAEYAARMASLAVILFVFTRDREGFKRAKEALETAERLQRVYRELLHYFD